LQFNLFSMKIYLLFLLIFVYACHTSSPAPNEQVASKKLTTEDSLYKEVIGYHDEAMPKMGKLIGYQKALKIKIDSLENVGKKKKDTALIAAKKRYEAILIQMQAAEKQMNNWMDSFDPDPKFPSREDLLKYWKEQQQKAKIMRDDILQSIDSAKSVLQ